MTISDDRIKELRKRASNYGSLPESTINDILDDYSSLRAENERLKENVQRCEENYAEALHLASTYQETAEKAEAQLAKQAPLIEAVMGVPFDSLRHLVEIIHMGENSNTRAILRAALALREEKK